MEHQLALPLELPTWKVTTRDSEGKIVAFEVEADNHKDARRAVRNGFQCFGAVLVQIK